ncbi:NTP transferase domain-containing protein [Shimia sp. R9_1]|uniref:sugar phosphate nucleotidyltransferase n=1 Tax=Shimia sp. R9_1 TaxID=2821111 RepID=UPI001ADCD8D9|nr:sugar phosphate nucleotidyltransferase [Shimia sp. R9_1]MBO9406220.1 NTP transferase domain-containing protein [Shimia sp. R9_1]
MLTTSEDLGMISVMKVATSRLTSADFAALRKAQMAAEERGRFAHLVDLSGVRRAAVSGLAALLEFQSAAKSNGSIAFFGAQPAVKAEINKLGIAPLLSLFDTRKEVLAHPAFRACQLAGVKSVLLVAGAGSRMAPISHDTPKPLVDLLGQPVIEHVMRHLESFGLRDFILNPGHLGPQFHTRFKTTAHRSIQFFNEGQFVNQRWQPAPLGSAGTLLALQAQCAAFEEDFFVFCGDALINIDLAEMMAQHRASGAEVTVAAKFVPHEEVQKYGIIEADGRGRITHFVEKPAPEQTQSRLASTGIYVMKPSALRHLSSRFTLPDASMQGLDIAQHLLPKILKSGTALQVYEAPFDWVDIGCPKDYFAALSKALRGLIAGVSPEAQEVRRHVWLAPGAELSARAVVVGPCYIGPGAKVSAGAKLDGPTVVGAGARVAPRALVQRSILMPNTAVAPGTWLSDVIVSADWAIDHRFADGGTTSAAPMEGVTHAEVAQAPVGLPRVGSL